MKLRSILFSVALGAFAAGCGGSDGEKFGSLADEVCKCETMECANGVRDKWKKLEEELEKKYEGEGKKEPPKDLLEAYEKAEDKAEACVTKLREKTEGAEGGEEG